MKPQASDVVFVFPPAQGNVGAFKNHLGAAYLRAALAREGLATTQYRQEHPGSVHTAADEILRYRPRIVGFTVYDANFSVGLALARRLKKTQPGVQIVFGGPTVTFAATDILKTHDVIDVCVMGEAEETGPSIFRQLIERRDVGLRQPGIAIRRDGKVLCSAMPPLVGARHLDSPAQAALDISPSPYLSGILTGGRSGVLTARGCTHHCQYCVFAALGGRTLRLHSIERVLAELDIIASHQKRTGEAYVVPIHDDAFTLLPVRAKALCQAIAHAGLGLNFSCITRADRIDDELLRLMRKAGFVSLAFGLESAVPSVLRATGKVRPPNWPDPDLTPEQDFIAQVRASVVAAKKHGFTVGVSIILGLPSETASDGEATLRFVSALPIDYYFHNFLQVFAGTPLSYTHDKYEIASAPNHLGLRDTTRYSYDVAALRPRPKCTFEEDGRLIQLLAAEALYGCGAAGTRGRGIEAVVIRAPELQRDTAQWLADILNVGGLVLQVYPRGAVGGEAVCLGRDRRVFSESLVPGREYLQLLPKVSRSGSERWQVACAGVDVLGTHKPSLLSLRLFDGPAPLIDWLRGKAFSGVLCEVAEYLRQPTELIDFLEGLAEDDFACHLRSMAFPPGLKYASRWLKGTAPCRNLTRLEVNEEGIVRTCTHGAPIGKIGDTMRTLTRQLDSAARDAEARRGCAACPNTHCPRCPFPGLDDQTYCSLMTEQARSLCFLNCARLYSRLPVIVALQHDRLVGN